MNNAAESRGLAVLLALVFLSTVPVSAQETGHYVPGLSGLKGATVPAPGFYYANLTLRYDFDRINDPDGNPVLIEGGIPTILGNVSSFFYVFEPKILGARLGIQANIPVTNRAFMADRGNPDQVGRTGVADIYIQPINLGWGEGRNRFNVRYGFFAPTGRFDSNGLNNTGKGFWTHMFTVGNTVFLGPDNSWHGSALFRYETHTKKSGVDRTAGDDIVVDWGFGKTLGRVWDVGLTGASTWQITRESGTEAPVQSKYSAHAVGGEIQYAIPKARLSFRFRTNFDVATRDRGQGYTMVLMLVWKPS